MSKIIATVEELKTMGYNQQVAEALVGRDYSVIDVQAMTADEVFGEFLNWHGIVGFKRSIINALDNCRNVEAL